MSSFNEIRAMIQKNISEGDKAPTVSQVSAAVIPTGTVQQGRIGTIVSAPGTEKIVLEATTFQLMECQSPTVDKQAKHRFCIVEKNIVAKYGNQFINSAGFRTHIITKEVFLILHSTLHQVSTQLKQLSSELNLATEQKDLYKSTIEALRRNGVIE
jgi:hypothetical protein